MTHHVHNYFFYSVLLIFMSLAFQIKFPLCHAKFSLNYLLIWKNWESEQAASLRGRKRRLCHYYVNNMTRFYKGKLYMETLETVFETGIHRRAAITSLIRYIFNTLLQAHTRMRRRVC